MTAYSHPDAVSNTSWPAEGPSPESAKTYGYTWADWLYGYEKDAFMVGVYNDCRHIDGCTDPAEKARTLLSLRNKVQGCRKTWVDGVIDFIEFESQFLLHGVAPLDDFYGGEDYHSIATVHAAYVHGAFRGLCRTANGAEWIGELGEFCAAAVHQGFKWVRLSGGVSGWELPALGESWCKGVVLWGLVSMCVAVDVAGGDPGNDAALDRIHALIGAHHFAGSNWLRYRGPHPHKWWEVNVRGRAPSELSIRRFGERHGWPEQTISVLCRGANHVNSWNNLPFDKVYLERMRGLLIWDHTPRLKSRLTHVGHELAQLVDNVTDSEVEEIFSRCATWLGAHSATWRGRGDRNDRVLEISLLGAALGVLRDSRTHVSVEFVDRAVEWCKKRIGHLSPDLQDLFLNKILRGIQIRGRVPGAVDGYGSEGAGPLRYHDGWWEVATWACILAHPAGGKEVPTNMRELITHCFNVWTKNRRLIGVDISTGLDEKDQDCPICLGNSIFEGSVDNRPTMGVWQLTTWGILLYHNLGLGTPDDIDLGCRGSHK